MKFDSNLAWRQASAAVLANRQVLIPLAGVFFFLPRLLLGLFMPEPPTNQNIANPAQAMAAMQDFYLTLIPYILPAALVQASGTLSLLTLFTDTRRPTVGEAILLGLKGVLPYLLSQLLFILGLTLVLGVFVGLSLATKSPIAIGVVVVMAIIAAVSASIRMILVTPVIAVEHVYNPWHALRRSWSLTKGNSLRLIGFLSLISLVAGIAMLAATGVVGALAGLAGGPEAARIASAIITGLIAALAAAYLAGILAAIHRQLAGPSLDAIAATFE